MATIKEIEVKIDDQSEKIREIRQELSTMNATLIVNTEQLKLHIEGVRLARQQNEDYRREMDQRLKPIEEANILARGYIKAFMFFIGMPAAIYYLTKIYDFIKSV
jgi:hypothetical protein